jgi:hypothetical protein
MSDPLPGWYADPWDATRIRYWDGAAWSPHSLPQPGATDMPGGLATVGSAGSVRPWWQSRFAILTAVGGLLLGIALLAPGNHPATTADSDTAPHSSPSPTTAPTPEQRVLAKVPSVTGMNLARARQQLRARGLRIGRIERRPSAKRPGTVLDQGFYGGARVRPGATVPLVIAVLLPQVPSVVGTSRAAAIKTLEAAGFEVITRTETRTSGTAGMVLSQGPTGEARAQPGSVVHLVIAHVVPAPSSGTGSGGSTSDCTPGYSPCLPLAYDYDCAGGSGDGPEYANGPIRVTGSDPYDLDRDGDGVACES